MSPPVGIGTATYMPWVLLEVLLLTADVFGLREYLRGVLELVPSLSSWWLLDWS